MQADLSAVDFGARIFFAALILLNLLLARLLWRRVPLLERRGARLAYLALLVVFNLPAVAMIVFGHHLPAHLPEWLVSAVFLPALAWHMTHFFGALILLAASPLWLPWGAYRGVRWVQQRLDGGEAPRVDSTRRRFLRNAGLVVPAAMYGGLLVSAVGSQTRLEVAEVDVPVRGLPPDLDGLRIVQVSDLHVGSFIRLDDVEGMVKRINELSPDLFVFTGDLCDVHEVLGATCRSLSAIDASIGRFAALGNHEYFFDTREVRRRLDDAGVFALVDEHRRLDAGGSELIVAATDFAWTNASFGLPKSTCEEHAERAMAGIRRGGSPVIGLAHDPRNFDPMRERGADLVLSGHVHGGQIVLWDSDDGPIAPIGLGISRFKGLYREGDAHLYVTNGVGHWMPLRINCPREIVALTLRTVV